MEYSEQCYGNGVWHICFGNIFVAVALNKFREKYRNLRITAITFIPNVPQTISTMTLYECILITEPRDGPV